MSYTEVPRRAAGELGVRHLALVRGPRVDPPSGNLVVPVLEERFPQRITRRHPQHLVLEFVCQMVLHLTGQLPLKVLGAVPERVRALLEHTIAHVVARGRSNTL